MLMSPSSAQRSVLSLLGIMMYKLSIMSSCMILTPNVASFVTQGSAVSSGGQGKCRPHKILKPGVAALVPHGS